MFWTRNPDTLHAAAAVSYILTAVKSEFLKMKSAGVKMSVTCQQKYWPCNSEIHHTQAHTDNRTHQEWKLYFPSSTLNSMQIVPLPALCRNFMSPSQFTIQISMRDTRPSHKHRALITVSKLLLFGNFLRKLKCDFSALPLHPCS